MTCNEIDFDRDLVAFGRSFRIFGVDLFTQNYFLEKYHKHFPLGEIEKPAPRAAVVV